MDGRPLGGTVNDPRTQLNSGFAATMLLAGLNAALSAVAMLGQVELLLAFGFGWATLAESAMYAGLGWLGKYRQLA